MKRLPFPAFAFIAFTIWALFRKEEKVRGGFGDSLPDSAFSKKSLKKGMKVEMEHTTDPDIAKEIAKDHLTERADYYDRLEELEKTPIKKVKNPKIIKGKKLSTYTTSSEITKENVGFAKLPDNPKGFISWEPNTYQACIFDSPENVTQENMKAFLPRNVTKGRVLPWGMKPPFQMYFKDAPKSLISAAQYIVEGDEANILFMSTRPGWKRLGLMSALIDAIKEQHNVKSVKYWEPTEAGKKFAKKKNPATRCTYEMNVSFRRGRGPLQKRSLYTQAWDQAEARQIFQYQIDRNLRDVSLESLQIRRVHC